MTYLKRAGFLCVELFAAQFESRPSVVSHAQSSSTVPVPQHIAIIMDGNRRWAQQFGMPAALGHASGARQVRVIVQA